MTHQQLTTIHEMPTQERPRERLLRHGSQTLSEAELLAVLLRTGGRGRSVLEMARELLDEWGGLARLPGLAYGDLRRRGLGEAKAATLLAALEIARRLAREELPERQLMKRPDSVADYLALRYCRRDQEIMGGLFLDTRHRLLGEREFFRGTLQRTSVEPRVILKEALVRGAGALLLFHTHPSGDPSPSLEDLSFTRRMVKACDVMGVPLVDHLILGGAGRWASLRQRKPW
ncbi:MAG: DNA repair protein RadC [Acidobacteriota bacterium]|nr:DNA repair protein RadC [Acidobacteriota bacterium]